MSEKFEFDERITEKLTPDEKAELEKQLEDPAVQNAMKALEGIFARKDTAEWLSNVQSAEELSAGLKERGAEMDDSICQQLYEDMKTGKQDELSEKDLDSVAGGGIVLGVAIGVGGVVLAGAIGYCAYKWLKKNFRIG